MSRRSLLRRSDAVEDGFDDVRSEVDQAQRPEEEGALLFDLLCLKYGEYIYSAETLSCRELPVSHYPDATDSDSAQEHLQQAFERYGTIREIPFL